MKISTPRPSRDPDGTLELIWNPQFGRNSTLALERVQKFVDNEVLRLSAPYVPFRTGALNRSGMLGTEVGSGDVVYNAPYARYLYYGEVMAGRAPKKLTGKPIRYAGAPARGAKWFEKMKATHRANILRGAAMMAQKEFK